MTLSANYQRSLSRVTLAVAVMMVAWGASVVLRCRSPEQVGSYPPTTG